MKRAFIAGAAASALLLGGVVVPSFADAGPPSLPGSDFEIEVDANLKEDGNGVDWLTPVGVVKDDLPTGQTDNSYKGGTKEDTVCPAETTGSIPNNKSDLKTFRVYAEPGKEDHPGFLNIAWTRVNEPSGTTLMDFEFNQSGVSCDTGPNKLRTEGDFLVEYLIDQGGKSAEITLREWTGTAWGQPKAVSSPQPECDDGPCAVGTINESDIPAGEGGPQSQYTFGEAQIDLRTIFDPGKCESFGSAMLKSRSSDSFTSQLKDFIAPQPINLTNCGKVIIRKETIPAGQPGSFGFTKAFDTDPANGNTFNLAHGESETFDGVLFGTGLTVEETGQATGFQFDSVDCSASSGVTPSIAGAKVTFDIDSASDVLDCTYKNKALAKFTVKKIIDPATSTAEFDFAPGDTLPAGDFKLGHDGTKAYSDLAPGTVSATETVPATGWDLTKVECTGGTNIGSGATAKVELAPGDDVTCTFFNRERAEIIIIKVDDTGAPLVGAKFQAAPGGQECTTALVDHDSDAGTPDRAQCTLSNLVPDQEYTITETVTPAGYQTAAPQKVTPDAGETVELTFTNKRLFRVIAFVCQESDNTLYGGSADVNSAGATATTATVPAAVQALLDAGVTSEQIQEALCGLDAKFGGLTTGTYSGSVTID